MAAVLTNPTVDCAPGNTLVLAGSGFGTSGTVSLANQGVLAPAPLIIPATFAGTTVTLTVPDGVTSETLTVTAQDSSQATCYLAVTSQYLQASQYSADAEGTDAIVAALSTGSLDNVLRDASGYIDNWLGTTLRLLQIQEDLPYSESRKIWPLRGPRRRIPLVSLDALSFITSNAIVTQFNVTGSAPDVYVNTNLGYCDVQTYAVGNAILLGAIQTIGFSANVWRLVYTAGFTWEQTPYAIRKATAMIATELLTYRNIQFEGLGGLSRVKQGTQQYDRRNESFAIPQPALDLLKPYCPPSFW